MSNPSGAVVPADGSGAMFDGIAVRYDLLNALMSLGMHHRWRRRLVDALGLPGAEDLEVLDVAAGTGDVAIEVARRYPRARVVGVDPSSGMLAQGVEKVRGAGLAERVELVVGQAESLPYEAGRFAACTIAFGIRNVPDRAAALREMVRVIRPGGAVGVLELTEPTGGPMAWMARAHTRLVVPVLGLLTSFAGAYRYLPRSIARFPSPAAFEDELRAAGLRDVRRVRMMFGAVHVFTGRRTSSPP